MEDVTLSYAKEHLEELVERAARGEDVTIADPRLGGVRLQPVTASTIGLDGLYPPRIVGQWKHLAEIPDERLFAPLTEEELSWLSGEQSGGG